MILKERYQVYLCVGKSEIISISYLHCKWKSILKIEKNQYFFKLINHMSKYVFCKLINKKYFG